MAKKRKTILKKSEDLSQLLELAKTPRKKYVYTTTNNQNYEIEIDEIFTIGKIQEVFEEYFVISMCANKFATKEENKPDSTLLFAILIQEFTDKRFVDGITNPMDKLRRYIVVADTLHKIELDNGLTLFQQIIVDFGEDNLTKIEQLSKTFVDSLEENKDMVADLFISQDEDGDEDGDKEIPNA